MSESVTRTYRYLTFPGHGYLEVPMEDLKEVGHAITGYDYVLGNRAYLEEDCNMSEFIARLEVSGVGVLIEDMPITEDHHEYFMQRGHRYGY